MLKGRWAPLPAATPTNDRMPCARIVGFVAYFVLFMILVVDIEDYPQQTLTIASDFSDWLGVLTTQPVYLAMVLGVVCSPRKRTRVAWASVLLLVAGTMLLFLGTFVLEGSATMPCRFAGLLLLGCGIASGFSLWANVLAGYSIEKSVRLIIAAYCVSALARLVFSMVRSEVLFWSVLAVALVCASASLVVIGRDPEDGEERSQTSFLSRDELSRFATVMAKDYWPPLVCFLIALFTSSLVFPLDSPSLNITELAVYSMGSLVGCVVLLTVWRRTNVLFFSSNIFAKYAILLIVMLFFLPFFGITYLMVAVFVCGAVSACALIILLTICIEVTKERRAFSFAVSSFAFFTFGFCLTLGTVVSILARTPVNGQPTASMISLIGIAFIAVVALLSAIRWGVAGDERKDDDAAPAAKLVNYSKEDLRTNSVLVERYKLSEREMDVLILILSAYSASRIAEALFISNNTVKAHTKNLYSKLGVHSKQELLDLVALVYDEGTVKRDA